MCVRIVRYFTESNKYPSYIHDAIDINAAVQCFRRNSHMALWKPSSIDVHNVESIFISQFVKSILKQY